MSNSLTINQINALRTAASYALRNAPEMSSDDRMYLEQGIYQLDQMKECTSDKKITDVTFPEVLFQNRAYVTYDNGETENLFGFYKDEYSFSREELLGKTREEALQLRRAKDVAYLRS